MSKKTPKRYEYPTPVQVRLSPEVRDALKRLASSEHRTLNNYLSVLLENHVRSAEGAKAA